MIKHIFLSKTGIEYISVTIVWHEVISKALFLSTNFFFLHFENESCFMLEICQLLQIPFEFYLRLYTTVITHCWNKKKIWVYEILANCVIEWKYSYEQKCCDLWLCLNEVNTGGCDAVCWGHCDECPVSVFQFQYSNKPKEKHCL